jgi:hypothetical protein
MSLMNVEVSARVCCAFVASRIRVEKGRCARSREVMTPFFTDGLSGKPGKLRELRELLNSAGLRAA